MDPGSSQEQSPLRGDLSNAHSNRSLTVIERRRLAPISTAVYGPVRTVCWGEGRSREAPPYRLWPKRHLHKRSVLCGDDDRPQAKKHALQHNVLQSRYNLALARDFAERRPSTSWRMTGCIEPGQPCSGSFVALMMAMSSFSVGPD